MARRLLPCAPLLALLAACGGGDGAVVRGSLRPDQLGEGDTLFARVEGVSGRVPVLDRAFALEEVAPGAVTLLLGRAGGDAARMELDGVPEGGAVELRGIRIDGESGLAFPASVAVEGAPALTVNGLRYTTRPLPARVAADGAVLAVSDAGDALLVRPADGDLPDLRVVVGPLTETTTTDGDPVPPSTLERGDSVRVEGDAAGAYVVARRIVGPRELALREAGAEEGASGPGDPPDDGPETRAEAAAAGAPAPRSGEARNGSTGRDERRGEERGRGKGRGRGGEKGKGKGKGRG